MKKAIFISGIIGSGKSTLAKSLATKFNLELRNESIKDESIIPKIYEFYESFDSDTIVEVQQHFIKDSSNMISSLKEGVTYVFDTFPFESQRGFIESLYNSEFIDKNQYSLLNTHLGKVSDLECVEFLHIHCLTTIDIYSRILNRGTFEIKSFVKGEPSAKFVKLMDNLDRFLLFDLVTESTVFSADPNLDSKILDFLNKN